ncbi:MAG: DEAD/DEAH box helicase [Rhodocyclaceae bacterium]|nr:DEAD/DEAH box helicase [Rhodocyclaceae bacterium]
MHFTDLGLCAEILRSISEQGYDTPTPIQAQAIPLVLEGRDLMAAAQTGTGKTAGFTLPILQLLSTRDAGLSLKRFKSRALILVPTRELAVQVHDSVRTYGKHLGLKAAAIYGGVGMAPQTRSLRAGVDIIVATPGRLLDHIEQRSADLSGIEILVLDEADRMLDMGFIRDIRKVIALLPKQKQTLLFSATFSDEIRGLVAGLLKNPASVEVARRNAPAEAVAQSVYHVDRERKRDLLIQLIDNHGWHQVLVFTRTKHGADALSERLGKAGIKAAALHGNKSQGQRQRALDDFKRLKVTVLVATDIAARGIDIDELPHVVNYELPHVAEDYVHRIGRTGRAGSSGEAISLVCVDEHRLLRDIERLLKKDIEKRTVEGFEPDPRIRPEPIQNGRGGGARSSQPRGAAPSGQRKPQRAAPGGKPAARSGGQRQGAGYYSGAR